jgi:antitoxin VapB
MKPSRNGRHQDGAHIPVALELASEEAVARCEEDKQVIQPLLRTTILEWLATIESSDDAFPEIGDEPTKSEDIS